MEVVWKGNTKAELLGGVCIDKDELVNYNDCVQMQSPHMADGQPDIRFIPKHLVDDFKQRGFIVLTTDVIKAKKAGNLAFAGLYNKFVGRTAFLVGCAPSFTDEVATKLMDAKALTIGVNQCYRAAGGKFLPTFHLHQDKAAGTDMSPYLLKMQEQGTHIFYPSENTVSDDVKAQGIKYTIPEGEGFQVGFEPLAGLQLYNGAMSIYLALQVAFLLGCNPIVLIGVDCQVEKKGKLHFYDNSPATKKQTEEAESLFNSGEFHLTKNAVPVLKETKRLVFNASPKSYLSCFPKVPLDSIL